MSPPPPAILDPAPVRLDITLPDSDPHQGFADTDPRSISTNCKAKLYFFPDNFNILSKILKIMTPIMLTRKAWHCCE
jgi:hypothetical protein